MIHDSGHAQARLSIISKWNLLEIKLTFTPRSLVSYLLLFLQMARLLNIVVEMFLSYFYVT